jgi:hypothetical protein
MFMAIYTVLITLYKLYIELLYPHVSESLIYCGANGSISGDDFYIKFKDTGYVDVEAKTNIRYQEIQLMVLFVHNIIQSWLFSINMHTLVVDAQFIHLVSFALLKNSVHTISSKVKSGLQHFATVDRYIHPISIVNCLPSTSLRPYLENVWDALSHVVWTDY